MNLPSEAVFPPNCQKQDNKDRKQANRQSDKKYLNIITCKV